MTARGSGLARLALAVLPVAALPLAQAGCRDEAEEAGAPTHQVRVTVTVPEGSPVVYLTGSLGALGPWDPAALAMEGEGRVRTAVVEAEAGSTFEYKFTLGSWDREGLGPSGTVLPNFRLEVDADREATHEIVDFRKDPSTYIADWKGSGVLGTLVYWTGVSSAYLAEPRSVGIWLPPGYDDDPERRYRVLYMHDGQNLFDPRLANTGVDWGVDEAMMAGVEAGRFEPAIVVGVWNTPDRLEEYSPWHGAEQYARFLIDELMPRVDAAFRTLTGPENTFVMGSSMGGLLSYHLVKEHPTRFSACGCVSTHFPLSADMERTVTGQGGADATPYILRDIAEGETVPRGVRLSFDYGTEGLDAGYGPTHDAVRAWLLGQGLAEGKDFQVRRYEGADHSERAWRARVGDQLEWLLAPRR